MDGFGVLHELYESKNLEWASGGCYAEQHRATETFFNSLIQSGVEPVVILDGAGTEASIDDAIHRRNRNINSLLDHQKEHHKGKEGARHHLPVLSRHVYSTSLRQVDKLQVYIADGKAFETIISLANHYNCPVLTNNTKYCVGEVPGGVILFKLLDIMSCTAPVYHQDKLVQFLSLPDPDLVFAILAITGDSSDNSVPYMYHGRVKAVIERSIVPSMAQKKSLILKVTDYLKSQHVHSWEDFRSRIPSFRYGGQTHKVMANCESAWKTYKLSSNILTLEILQTDSTLECSSEKLPQHILAKYRCAAFPSMLVSVICEGKCILHPSIGDPDQNPIPELGRPVREMIYSLALPLVHSRSIKEYYRSERPTNIDGKDWSYVSHEVKPECRKSDLSILVESEQMYGYKEVAIAALCGVIQSPSHMLTVLSGPIDDIYTLAILSTYYWAQHITTSNELDQPHQLIQALVLNFLFSIDRDEHKLQEDLYADPMWIKCHHALLEWQSLYLDMCHLNSVLNSPLRELPPTNILDSPFVVELALHPSPEIITTYRGRLSKEKQEQYDKFVKLILP